VGCHRSLNRKTILPQKAVFVKRFLKKICCESAQISGKKFVHFAY
jgi:hypothetical protein